MMDLNKDLIMGHTSRDSHRKTEREALGQLSYIEAVKSSTRNDII